MSQILRFDEAVKKRRSVRIYTDQPLDKALVKECIEEATLAPTSSNMQLWSFHHITSRKVLDEMIPFCFNQSAAKYAQQMVVIAVRKDLAKQRARHNKQTLLNYYGKKDGDELTKREKASIRYYDQVMPLLYTDFLGIVGGIKWVATRIIGLFKNVYRQVSSSDMRIVGHKSAGLGAQTFMLSMAARGIGTCPMEGFDSLRVKKLLGLPRGAEINMIISCGHPAEDGIFFPRFRVPFEQVYQEH